MTDRQKRPAQTPCVSGAVFYPTRKIGDFSRGGPDYTPQSVLIALRYFAGTPIFTPREKSEIFPREPRLYPTKCPHYIPVLCGDPDFYPTRKIGDFPAGTPIFAPQSVLIPFRFGMETLFDAANFGWREKVAEKGGKSRCIARVRVDLRLPI